MGALKGVVMDGCVGDGLFAGCWLLVGLDSWVHLGVVMDGCVGDCCFGSFRGWLGDACF